MHVAMDNTMTYAHICPLVHFHLPHPPGYIPAEDLFAGSVAADKWFQVEEDVAANQLLGQL